MSGPLTPLLTECGLRALQQRYDGYLDCEDSLNLAIEAAEIHLKALRLSTDTSQKKALKSKTLALFEEAEKIKSGNDFSSNDRVYQMVFGVASAREIERQGQGTASPDPRVTERPPSVKTLLAPVSRRAPTTREQKVLLEGSLLNGAKFPAWKEADGLESFELVPGEEQFL